MVSSPRVRPQAIQVGGRTTPAGLAWSPPLVEVRPLQVYEQLLEVDYDA